MITRAFSKKVKRLLSASVTVAMLLSMSAISVHAADGDTIIKDTILYTINAENKLEYNVVYATLVQEGVTIGDKTGNEIDTIDELNEALGEAVANASIAAGDMYSTGLNKAVTADLVLNASDEVVTITITDVRDRPTVGISWKGDSIGNDYKGFAEAFERNGAYARLLPKVTTEEEAAEVLATLDGIFMTGGSDVDPALYDEAQTPHGSSGWNIPRDTSDILMIQAAIEEDLPLLGVCRGEQIFNVAMGGGLIQDVPYYLGQQVQAGEIEADRVTGILSGTLEGKEPVQDTGYRMFDEDGNELGRSYNKDTGYAEYDDGCKEGHLRVQVDDLSHGNGYHNLDSPEGTAIDTESKWLYGIVGDTSIDLIATAHHQSVNPEKLGKGLTIVAHSSDTIVEAIEYQDNLFALGVQWHPERDALRDSRNSGVDLDLCNAFLRALVNYAGTYVDLNSGASSSSGSGKTAYTTTVTATKNGTVKVSPVASYQGKEVTITVTPDKGMELGRISAVDSAGEKVELTKVSEHVYTFIQPNKRVTVTATFMVEGLSTFVDVDTTDWFYDGVHYVYGNDLMSGYSNTTFAPNDTLTRGMIAQILWVVEGEPVVSDASAFSDVSSDAWYAHAVNWAYAKGIISGYSSTVFAPNDPVTREQLATMLWKYVDSPSADGDLSAFNDQGSISPWARTAMTWVIEADLMSGMGNGILAPTGTATRAQVATILMEFCENVVK